MTALILDDTNVLLSGITNPSLGKAAVFDAGPLVSLVTGWKGHFQHISIVVFHCGWLLLHGKLDNYCNEIFCG